MHRLSLLAPIVLSLAAAHARGAPHPEAARTIVLASKTVPEGVEVARHYMAARGIPEGNLCLVSAPAAETITREQFDATLWEPVRAFLARWSGRLDVARRMARPGADAADRRCV